MAIQRNTPCIEKGCVGIATHGPSCALHAAGYRLFEGAGRSPEMIDVLTRLKASIRRWCDDGSDECAGPIEFICEELEPMIDVALRGDAAAVSDAPSGEKFDWQNLREVLCNVSQIFNGWRPDDCWSTWDEEVAQAVVAIQRQIDVPPVELRPLTPEGKT